MIPELDGHFTLQNVVRVLREIKSWDFWWSFNSTRWRWVGGALLYITITKMDDIASTCSTTDDEEGLRKVVKVWMDTCPYASWRWLIWRMDEEHPNQGNVHDLADLIRRYAEPAGVKNDPSLTVENVATVLSNVKFPASSLKLPLLDNGVTRPFGLPPKTSKEAFISSWLASPIASWEVLVGGLYSEDETEALELTKEYMKTVPDSTFTFPNVWTVVKDLVFDPALLDLPQSVQNDPGDLDLSLSEDLKRNVRYYLQSHPAPSWHQLAYNLYTMGAAYLLDDDSELKVYDVLKTIHKKYLKGLNLQELCIQVIASSLNCTDDVDSLPLPVALKTSVRTQLADLIS